MSAKAATKLRSPLSRKPAAPIPRWAACHAWVAHRGRKTHRRQPLVARAPRHLPRDRRLSPLPRGSLRAHPVKSCRGEGGGEMASPAGRSGDDRPLASRPRLLEPRERDPRGGVGSKRKILVGIDSSESSRPALSWAARQHRLPGSSVEPACLSEPPLSYGWPVAWVRCRLHDRHRDSARRTDRRGARSPARPRSRDARGRGPAGSDAGRAVERGRPRLRPQLRRRALRRALGSVSCHLAQHCHCDLVVVRLPATQGAAA